MTRERQHVDWSGLLLTRDRAERVAGGAALPLGVLLGGGVAAQAVGAPPPSRGAGRGRRCSAASGDAHGAPADSATTWHTVQRTTASSGLGAWGLWQVPQSNCMGADSEKRAGALLGAVAAQAVAAGGQEAGSGERKSWQTKQWQLRHALRLDGVLAVALPAALGERIFISRSTAERTTFKDIAKRFKEEFAPFHYRARKE